MLLRPINLRVKEASQFEVPRKMEWEELVLLSTERFLRTWVEAEPDLASHRGSEGKRSDGKAVRAVPAGHLLAPSLIRPTSPPDGPS